MVTNFLHAQKGRLKATRPRADLTTVTHSKGNRHSCVCGGAVLSITSGIIHCSNQHLYSITVRDLLKMQRHVETKAEGLLLATSALRSAF
jgi:hypothetical protein